MRARWGLYWLVMLRCRLMVENLRPNQARELPYRLTLHPASLTDSSLSTLSATACLSFMSVSDRLQVVLVAGQLFWRNQSRSLFFGFSMLFPGQLFSVNQSFLEREDWEAVFTSWLPPWWEGLWERLSELIPCCLSYSLLWSLLSVLTNTNTELALYFAFQGKADLNKMTEIDLTSHSWLNQTSSLIYDISIIIFVFYW